mmetsp:Transcript_36205/g.72662  ORF Transcript_36205/g.72662 Transcript_36205/m.72662 type:complete len:199 (+) Transcript_36205:309-905(+)
MPLEELRAIVPCMREVIAERLGAATWPLPSQTGMTDRSEEGCVDFSPHSSKRLFELPCPVLGELWPANRAIIGLRVSKYVRQALLEHGSAAVLVRRAASEMCTRCIVQDLLRLSGLQITLRMLDKDGTDTVPLQKLVPMLVACSQRIVQVELSLPVLNPEEVTMLGAVFTGCPALAHLDLRRYLGGWVWLRGAHRCHV